MKETKQYNMRRETMADTSGVQIQDGPTYQCCTCTGLTMARRTTEKRHSYYRGRIFITLVLFLSSLSVSSCELVMGDSVGDDVTEPMWIINEFNLDRNESNVCVKISLRHLTEFWSGDVIRTECERIYRPATCDALRSGNLSVSDLYIQRGLVSCCDGFQRRGSSTNCAMRASISQTCSLDGLCRNNGGCDPTTGGCTCPRGFTGDHCQYTCPDDRYGDGCAQTCNCDNGGSCHPQTGDCLCPIGFLGNACEIKCLSSTGGTTEDPRCSSPAFCAFCAKGSICEVSHSSCLCLNGWRGRFCTHTCRNFTYGEFCNERCQCRWSTSSWCDGVTGRCICRPGWTGVTCDQRCPSGSYGVLCQGDCDCPEDGCDPVDGRCSCPRGWHTQSCIHPCSRDRWGVNCSQKCNCADSEECDPISGQCYKSQESSTESQVTTQQSLNTDGSGKISTGLLATIIGLAVALILLAGIMILVLIQRNSRKREQGDGQSILVANPLQPTAPQYNGTLGNGMRYQDHISNGTPSRNSAVPDPLPRDPSTFANQGYGPVGDHNARDSSTFANPEYEALRGQNATGPSISENPVYESVCDESVPDQNSYLELDLNAGRSDSGGSARVDNPLYAQPTDDGYERPTLLRDAVNRSGDADV